MGTSEIQALVSKLCSPECAGRRPGTPGGLAARRVVLAALREAGLDPYEQAVPACGGANVLATVAGTVDRWVVVGAHFDHLGEFEDRTFWGADDNAAAVAALVEVARSLRTDHEGRGVIFAAFDGEEPPFFLSAAMGSQAFVAEPPVARETIDFMVCMDLVGHRLGPAGLPDEIGQTVFALGAEHSVDTLAALQSMARAEPGVVLRPADADIVPPLSDYDAFWRARIPFLFLSAGRSRVYHTPEDTPEKLDYPKIDATARWLARFVSETRRRDAPVAFDEHGAADLATLDQLAELVRGLAAVSEEAALVLGQVESLRSACGANGRLPRGRRGEVRAIVQQIEQRLG